MWANAVGALLTMAADRFKWVGFGSWPGSTENLWGAGAVARAEGPLQVDLLMCRSIAWRSAGRWGELGTRTTSIMALQVPEGSLLRMATLPT